MRLMRRRFRREAEELNITSFMNLMVILVPFLLITAVFSRMAILEINIPAAVSQANEKPPELQLEITVRANTLELRDKASDMSRTFPYGGEKTDWKPFNNLLVELKARFPKIENVTLLMEPEVDYQALITVMDKVRSTMVTAGLAVDTIELFPVISIGDAAPETANGSAK